MSLGDFFASLAGRLVREAASDAAERGLAAHANRKKPGSPSQQSVHFGRLALTLTMTDCLAIWLAFGVVAFVSIRLGEPLYSIWLPIVLGALAAWAALAMWDGLSRRIDWDGEHVRFRKWNSDRTVLWHDITGIEVKSSPMHVRIALRDGKGFVISEFMNGSRRFLAILERRLNPEPANGGAGGKRRRRRRRGKRPPGTA